MKLDCVICGRKGEGVRQPMHDGWCWYCVSLRVRGYNYNSRGGPWPDRCRECEGTGLKQGAFVNG